MAVENYTTGARTRTLGSKVTRPNVRLRMSVYVSAQDVVQSVTQLSHVESSLF